MNQNILIPVLTLLFYITSILGGGAPDSPALTPGNITASAVIGQQGEIVGDIVTIRTGPGTQHSALTSLKQGETAVILDLQDGWYEVKLTDGRIGWVADYLINIVPSKPQVKPHGKTVLGYYLLGSSSYNSLIQNSNYLTAIAPWSWGLDSYGKLNADFDAKTLAQVLMFSGNREVETYALVHNLFNGSFDPKVVSALLNNQAARIRAVNEIKTALVNWGMTGINLDLENVPAADRQALTEFVAELSEALHAEGLKVTMAVPAKTADNPSNNFSGAYDYAALGKHVDQLVIMAYDQHYRAGPPGPIASIKWVEDVIKFAVSQVPAEKIILGIPNYGYDWPQSGMADALTYDQTMQLAAANSASIRWQGEDKVPYFTYGNNRQVWFENRYSIKYKLELVNQYQLNGIALWRLGQEDSGIWNVINDTLK